MAHKVQVPKCDGIKAPKASIGMAVGTYYAFAFRFLGPLGWILLGYLSLQACLQLPGMFLVPTTGDLPESEGCQAPQASESSRCF